MVPIPNPKLSFADQDPIVLAAMLAWGEFRDQPLAAKYGGLFVVENRRKSKLSEFGGLVPGSVDVRRAAVILHKDAFSCFRTADPNYPKLLHPTESGPLDAQAWEICFEVATNVLAGGTEDNTNGALFYFKIGEEPVWKDKLVFLMNLGNSSFWRYPGLPSPASSFSGV